LELKQVLIKGGEAVIANVPAPVVSNRNILVSVVNSCISSGTEVAGLVNSGMALYQRALKQPSNILLALKMVREEGLSRTVRQINGVLSSGSVTGYSAAGTVIAVGSQVSGFSVGDTVACAGAGIANHAEIIDVPVNLAVKIPKGLSFENASTVTLGSIALQGVRRVSATFGETVVVIGLGILGQLTCQLLKLSGCRVVGLDLDDVRIGLAKTNGLEYGFNSTDEDSLAHIKLLTDGFGADAVVITASSSSHEIVSTAMGLCRKKGRVVLVGDVGLNLKREDFYVKELDFLISTSYGPGRYDPIYEQQGSDYPIGYVRWTENRNMQAYLAALSKGGITLDNLKGGLVAIDDVPDTYALLKEGKASTLIQIINYMQDEKSISRVQQIAPKTTSSNKVSVGLIGTGNFAQGMLLPNLMKLRKDFDLVSIMSRSGVSATAVARQYEARYASTDFDEVVSDSDIQLVVISTRHHLHAPLVVRALKSGKHVFVEKPLALNSLELEEIKDFYEHNKSAPILMTGFNRRFSPAGKIIKQALDQRVSPLMITYEMNAGYLPMDHWTHGQEGGGRNIGEACHIYDMFNYLVGSGVNKISATNINPVSRMWASNDNFTVAINFDDGSVCNLIYTSLGNVHHPKEKMQIYFDQRVITMTDYIDVSEAGKKRSLWSSKIAQKGHLEEFKALALCLHGKGELPMSFKDQVSAMEIAFEVEKQINHQEFVAE